jgi:hypothetical protein
MRSGLFNLMGVIAFLVVALVVVLVGYIFYENAYTPAAIDQAASINSAPTAAGQLSATAARALQAFGGETVWKNASTVESTVTVGGLLFQVKGARIPPHATITTDVKNPHTVIRPIDDNNDIGILDGFSVTIQSPDGQIIEQRVDARDHLQNATIATSWDRLNLLYFLGTAFWSYYALPYELTRSDIQWTELQDGVLQADYGPNLPAHSRIQRFWFDKQTGLLRRNDYTPTAAAADARVAHIIFAYDTSNGIPYASKRRVKITPTQQYGWVLPFPDVVTIDVEKWQLR